jgi:hypothetical protein
MTNAVIGVLMLVAFGAFYYLNIFATIRALLAFTGTILVGTGGHLLHWAAVAMAWVVTLGGVVTGWAFGTAVEASVTLIVLAVFTYDLWPKHSAGKRTGWAGIALALLLLSGASGIGFLNSLPGVIQSGVTSLQQSA